MIKHNSSLKILILLSYYNRPILLKNALNSIKEANKHHKNWELAFGDDFSKIPGKPIVEDILKDHLDKITFVNSNMKFEDKIHQGLILGKLANEAMRNSDADVAFILCDDDEIVSTYMKNLSDFFISNESIFYCYSKLHLYNPLVQKSENVNNVIGRYNIHNVPVNPVGKLDASQVAWRLSCCKEKGAWFEETTKFIDGKPWVKDTDRSFFENLYKKCGLCYPTGIIGQYKGIHEYQLLWHKNVPAGQLWSYNKMCEDMGGIVF